MWNWFKGRHGIRDGMCNVDGSDPKTTRGSGILIASRIILLKVPVEEVLGRRFHAICLRHLRPFHIAISRRNQVLVSCIPSCFQVPEKVKEFCFTEGTMRF
ncbi:hypothetical protein PanWU01x14_189270 [Parasponia andersonii]|uniref:Uncharacterized protein n=1 Tax=Parasponia andersonii TaxID=3476 RepID=A0A2P5C2E5_PARAD|nr:hypothetical protein PanWU01x14_189270 [Parasponia andersonii]